MHFHRRAAPSLTRVASAAGQVESSSCTNPRGGAWWGTAGSSKNNILNECAMQQRCKPKENKPRCFPPEVQQADLTADPLTFGRTLSQLDSIGWSHQVIRAVAPSTDTLTVFRKVSIFPSASFSSSVMEVKHKATQTFPSILFTLTRRYDSLHYLGQYAAPLMTTKPIQLPVVYHNYRHWSEHLSNHNEWAVLGAGCWSANEHWASPSIMPAINLSQLLTRACNEGVIFHGWSIAHIITRLPLKVFSWFRRINGGKKSKIIHE